MVFHHPYKDILSIAHSRNVCNKKFAMIKTLMGDGWLESPISSQPWKLLIHKFQTPIYPFPITVLPFLLIP